LLRKSSRNTNISSIFTTEHAQEHCFTQGTNPVVLNGAKSLPRGYQ